MRNKNPSMRQILAIFAFILSQGAITELWGQSTPPVTTTPTPSLVSPPNLPIKATPIKVNISPASKNKNPTKKDDLFLEPVIIQGHQISKALGFRIPQYGVYVAGPDHYAEPIPFQLDEVNEDGDYVLYNSKFFMPMQDNGIFDPNDEIALRGSDIGKRDPLIKWREKPFVYFEVTVLNTLNHQEGTFYIGVFKEQTPPRSKEMLLTYDHEQGIVETSKYIFKFNPKNHVLMDYVYIKSPNDPNKKEKVIENSEFFLIADIKYFFTLKISSKDVITKLNFWKIGPIRLIANVSFFFRLMQMNFDIEMYTEISLFENAVALPTILNSPMDAKSLFRKGSGFYYGLKLSNPEQPWKMNTNITRLSGVDEQKNSPRSLFAKVKDGFILTGSRKNIGFFLEFKPSVSLIKEQAEPFLHYMDNPREWVKARNTNIGIFMDTSNLGEGDYLMDVFMFFDNRNILPQNRAKMVVTEVFVHPWSR